MTLFQVAGVLAGLCMVLMGLAVLLFKTSYEVSEDFLDIKTTYRGACVHHKRMAKDDVISVGIRKRGRTGPMGGDSGKYNVVIKCRNQKEEWLIVEKGIVEELARKWGALVGG